ncbi:MAG: FAD binding domain-containing protein [Candidatus Binatia bacterium]
MKPPPFRYFSPASLSEALDLLSETEAEPRLLAGGQSLVPLLNLRLIHPRVLVDLNRIGELSYIRDEGSEVVIGAMTRQREVEFSGLLARKLPIMVEAVTKIGHPAIRNRGTIGGSLAHADPAAELPCVITALGAKLITVGPSGERTVGAGDFFRGLYTTALLENEILKEVRIPLSRPLAGWGFLEFSRRYGDFALAEVAVLLFSDADEKQSAESRVILGGAVDFPLRLGSVEALLEQESLMTLAAEPKTNLLKEAEGRTVQEIESLEGGNGSSEYRRHLAAVLVRRCLDSALSQWRDKWSRSNA